jgi:predicted nucleic acid-binding protein
MDKLLTLDCSVWVACAEPDSPEQVASRELMREVKRYGLAVNGPAFLAVELACALARKWRNTSNARKIAHALLADAGVELLPVNQLMLQTALNSGSRFFVRGADSLYVAAAGISGGRLISWDKEHVDRSGGIRPVDWLKLWK